MYLISKLTTVGQLIFALVADHKTESVDSLLFICSLATRVLRLSNGVNESEMFVPGASARAGMSACSCAEYIESLHDQLLLMLRKLSRTLSQCSC